MRSVATLIRSGAAGIAALTVLTGCASAAVQRAEAARLAATALPVCTSAADAVAIIGSEDSAQTRRAMTRAGLMTPEARFVLVDSLPAIVDKSEVTSIIRQSYPQNLRDRGIGGRIVLWLLVDETGTVADVIAHQSSGTHELDRAAAAAAMRFRFIPAVNNGCRHSIWVTTPVSYETW